MNDCWLKLTEPNGNPIWVGRIDCMYRVEATDGKVSYTVALVGGLKVNVKETPEQIINLLSDLMRRSP